MIRFVVPLLVFIMVVFGLWAGVTMTPKTFTSTIVTTDLSPRFALGTLEEPDVLITEASLKNKVTVMNVWASWCPACQTNQVLWLALAKQPDLHIIGLNYFDDLFDARAWLQEKGDPYQYTLYDKKGRVGMELGVQTTPEFFILDKKGVVRYRHQGEIKQKFWEETVSPLIKKLQEGN